MQRRRITIQDLYHIKVVNEPQISPDGERVIFSIQTIDPDENRYISHLYLVEISSGEVRQFTQGSVSDRQPQWSPDGQHIAFKRTHDKETQIWLISMSGGEARQLTNLEDGNLGTFSWSPDGGHLAFEFRPTHPDWTREARKKREEQNLSNPPRLIDHFRYRLDGVGFLDTRQQIWVCRVESGKTNPITEGDFDARDPAWSPDSRLLAFISNRSEDPVSQPYKQDIWLVPVEGGSLEKIQSPYGYRWGLSWSPNGKFLVYIGSETQDDPWGARNDRVWVLPTQGDPAYCLTQELDRIVENASITDLRGTGNQTPIWMPDSRGLYFLVSDRGNCHLYSVYLDSTWHQMVDGDIDITGFSADAAGKQLTLLASKPVQPTELFTFDFAAGVGGDLETLTNINAPLIAEWQPSLPEEIWCRSFDGTEIQGWLLKPPDFDAQKQYPMLLYIHGGPAAQYANTYFHEYQVLAAQGYVVLYTNPRGSLGREEEYATCIQGDWGHLDYQDLMAAVDDVEKLPYIDQNRMAVLGGSYGGFMVTWILGHTDRFSCAITERGVSNRHSAVGTTDNPPMPDGYWPGNIWEQPERYWQQSPLRLAAKIQTPLLIIHSEGDLRCPIGQAEQLYSALKRLKREVTFLRYPAETSHGFSRNGPPDLRIDRLQRIVTWLNKYLK